MSEETSLREAVTGLLGAAADLLKAMAERKRHCSCGGSHVCWHYYTPTVTTSVASGYPSSVIWSGGSSGSIGTG